MKSITPNERIVHNYKSAPYKSYIDADGREIPGQSYVQFDDTFPEGAGFTLYRMAPGSSSQPHEHTCHEQFFVIESVGHLNRVVGLRRSFLDLIERF